MTRLRALVLSVLLLLAPLASSQAQGQMPPQGMTQEQLDALVAAITKSVLENLRSEKVLAPAATAPAEGPDTFDLLLQQASSVLAAVPELGQGLARLVNVLDAAASGGRARGSFLLVLAAVIAAALASEALLRRAMHRPRLRLAEKAGPERGLRSLSYVAALALLDALGVLAFWLVGRASIAVLFSSASLQDRFAAGVLTGLLLWRIYALLFRVILRPNLAAARLCEVGEEEARRMYFVVSAFVLLVVAVRIVGLSLIALETSTLAVQAARLLFAPILVLGFLALVLGSRDAARQWFGGLGRVAPWTRPLGEHWVAVALAFFLAVVVTVIYGAVTGRQGVPGAMLLTVNLVFGLLIFETLLQALVRRLDSQLEGYTPAGNREKLPDVAARCVRVAALIVVVVVVSEHWAVDVLGLVDANAWEKLTRSARSAGITLFTAFVLWELVKFFTEAYMQRVSEKALQGTAKDSVGGSAASRLGTLMPLVRFTLAVLLGVVAVLIALSEIGVDITPLLAGLSVFGLAVSFGSQTLVKDIVSGIFYLADDAFRVGEFIDCGKATGVVEGFTLRSIRLRHSSGQIHTIPFGELGQIANFSRDWAAVKFTLRFARDTDLEKLRDAAKAVGADMMEVAALRADILEPLKMQGVADVADNALVVRFKFTARPGNPNRLQDEAVRRMLRSFPGRGIQFA